MPRIVHVARAQQRYATVPVLDADGQPKRTPVMKNGEQQRNKRGGLVTRAVTTADKSQPLPPATCDYAQCPVEDKVIAVGTPYKRMAIKTGPMSSRTLTRHESCPTWNTWDYSSSLSAQVDRVISTARTAIAEATEVGEVESAMECAADELRELADNKQEAAENMEEGFGAATSASEALAEQADQLREWADEIAGADIPEKAECPTCDGTTEVECAECSGKGTETCYSCDGAGQDLEGEPCPDCEADGDRSPGTIDCSECSGSTTTNCPDCEDGYDHDSWRDEVDDATSALDDCPL